MHTACVGPDSGRTFTRAVGDSLNRPGVSNVARRARCAADRRRHAAIARVSGVRCRTRHPQPLRRAHLPEGRQRDGEDRARRQGVEPAAHLSPAGADVVIGDVDLTMIQDVRARALLLVDLDDVVAHRRSDAHVCRQPSGSRDRAHEYTPEHRCGRWWRRRQRGRSCAGLAVRHDQASPMAARCNTSSIKPTGSLVDKTLSTAGQVISAEDRRQHCESANRQGDDECGRRRGSTGEGSSGGT